MGSEVCVCVCGCVYWERSAWVDVGGEEVGRVCKGNMWAVESRAMHGYMFETVT